MLANDPLLTPVRLRLEALAERSSPATDYYGGWWRHQPPGSRPKPAGRPAGRARRRVGALLIALGTRLDGQARPHAAAAARPCTG